MGVVYRAIHLTTGGEVAVKLLLGDDDDPHEAKRFALEAQNAAQLSHLATIRVTDFGRDGSLLYLAMELLRGRPLSQVLREDGPMPWARAVVIARQVLASLWEAHEHPARIVHRDIKPSNIFLLDQAGEPDRVKVLDFGISRSLASTGAGTQGFIGTPLYVAPELWHGEPIDGRTDLYALGCVVFEILTGRPPFLGPDGQADALIPLGRMHCEAPPPDLRALASGTPEGAVRWIERLLAKLPEDRPPSARVATDELDSLEAGAMPALTRLRPRALLGEKRSRPVVSWLVAGAMLGAVGLTVTLAVSEKDKKALAEPVCEPSDVRTRPGLDRDSYHARLSPADHLDAQGNRLTTAAAVMVRDRVNYMAKVRDAEDEDQIFFQSAEELDKYLRPVLEVMLDRGRADAARLREAILEHTPLVRLDTYLPGGGLCVAVVPD